MRIAVLGAGFTGLSAAYDLAKKGHEVVLFEKDKFPGGLASGFKDDNWQWPLEKYYHHCFANDDSILKLAKETNFHFLKTRPKTSTYIKGKAYQLDSALTLLFFPLLSISQRLRMGFVILYLKLNSNWKYLEKVKASEFLPKFMGKKAYKMVWEPLFKNKFGVYAKEISLTWFWARIKKRTSFLTYPRGGFQNFINHLSSEIKKNKGVIFLENEVIEIRENKKVLIKVKDKFGKQINYEFDKAICTIPSRSFLKISTSLPKAYRERILNFKYLCVHNLILRLKKPLLKNGVYWLNICDSKSPITGIVEHTNFIDKKHYNNEHIVYLLNYLKKENKKYQMDEKSLLKLYDPYLKKIKKDYKNDLININLFKDEFVQAIISTNYSKNILPFKTPLKNVFLANMDQVYPWDRGTNYAVELGNKIAKICCE